MLFVGLSFPDIHLSELELYVIVLLRNPGLQWLIIIKRRDAIKKNIHFFLSIQN